MLTNEIPSRWAVVKCGFGEGKKHLYSVSAAEYFEFHATEHGAKASAEAFCAEGGYAAVMRVEYLVTAKPIEFSKIGDQRGVAGPAC